MTSSLAAALAASKKGGPAAPITPPQKKNEPPRHSSLMQYQQKKEAKREDTLAATKKSQQKHGHAGAGKQHHHKTRNDTKISKNEASPSQRILKTDPNNQGHKKTDHTKSDGIKSAKKKGKKKGGKAPTQSNRNDDAAADGIVFVCDIPSDSDDTDHNDECDGVDADFYDGVDGDFEDDDFVDGDGAEEGECDSEVDDLDFDVVVIMDGSEKNETQNRNKGGRHGKVHRGGRGERSGKDIRSDRGHKPGGRGRGRGAHNFESNAGRGHDRNNRGRDSRSGNSTRNDRTDARDCANPNPPSNPGSMPTPWSTGAQASKNNNDHGGHNKNQRSRDNRSHAGQHAGRHSKDHYPTQQRHQHAPPGTSKNATPAFVPASSLGHPSKRKEAAASPVKLESAAIKGRWADEDSSDDE